ncbi:uncharacterized protein METZ01_LOCUS148787 [marine metagenome]|uniref:Uncharacterized protein n=1 Tax=marine metagenome TaxID=408172 RepID=A0A382A4R1_9ZZZZ
MPTPYLKANLEKKGGAAMKINHLIKLALVLFAFSGFVACSSSSEEVIPEEVAETTESGIDATTRRIRKQEEEARRRAININVF